MTAFLAFFVLYLITNLHYSPAEAGARASLLSLYSAPVSIVLFTGSGWLSDKMGRRKPFVIGSAAVMALALVIGGRAGSFNQFVIAWMVFAVGQAMYLTVDLALCAQVLPNEADTYPAASIQSLANGIDWAANNPSVDIITISGSIPTSDPRVEAAVANAVAKNKVVVAAAGNVEKQRGTQTTPASPDPKANLRYPAAYPGVIGVTAIDPTGAVPEGAVLHSPAVDLAAPGMNVVVANGTTGVCLASTQAPATSYATAYVAGAAALVRSYNSRSESAAMTSFRLLSSARRASPSTRDDVYGWGIVDPYRAMTLVDDGQLPGPDSPAHKRATQKPTAGSDVPPAPHDFQKTGRRSGAIWLSVAAGVIVVLLIFTAGRTRAARNKENESDAETGPVP